LNSVPLPSPFSPLLSSSLPLRNPDANLIPIYKRIMGDQLTPILAYKKLEEASPHTQHSFLFESVNNGTQQGRYSFVGARPLVEIVAKGNDVEVREKVNGEADYRVTRSTSADPLAIPEEISKEWRVPAEDLAANPDFPADVFTGGWVGYCGYDTVRYVYQGKLPFEDAPTDDRDVPDMHLALYQDTVLFDHATKLTYVVCWIDTRTSSLEDGKERLEELLRVLRDPRPTNLSYGNVDLSLQKKSTKQPTSNFTKDEFMDAIQATKEHILAGDVFQLVLSQRFERKTQADPFSVYRALRVVNPSPYMAYIRTKDATIVSSSPEILCRVDKSRKNTRRVTNRPLAGTRRRGVDAEEDAALEADLLQDEKEIAEHVMLVDLGRNDVGKVSKKGSVQVEKLMEVERYSHVMHISSTVTGEILDDLTCWDALRAALPAGTVSGAPKVRAMQILDELEKSKRGPYGGGFGWAAFGGGMDMALALRTMVVCEGEGEWVCHLQAGAGVVMDSVPESEFEETVNKAAALGRAIDLAEEAF
jgi:anthranilate synthase component I